MARGFEELFANNPKFARTVIPESFTDISLDAWCDFTAKELIAKGEITADWYCQNSNRVLSAPRQLGCAVLFDNSKLSGGRVNYNGNGKCTISHSEIAQIEQLLSVPAKYL